MKSFGFYLRSAFAACARTAGLAHAGVAPRNFACGYPIIPPT